MKPSEFLFWLCFPMSALLVSGYFFWQSAPIKEELIGQRAIERYCYGGPSTKTVVYDVVKITQRNGDTKELMRFNMETKPCGEELWR